MIKGASLFNINFQFPYFLNWFLTGTYMVDSCQVHIFDDRSLKTKSSKIEVLVKPEDLSKEYSFLKSSTKNVTQL